jgi:hypothetical protein
VDDQEAARFRDSLTVGQETIRDALAIWDVLRTHGESIVHAGFVALLVVFSLAGRGRERKTK